MEEVRGYQVLYDKNHPDFRDKQTKENCWLMISESLGVSCTSAKVRYNTIRTKFSKYLNTCRPLNGTSDEELVLKPEYEPMKWLMPHIQHRPALANKSPKFRPSPSAADDEYYYSNNSHSEVRLFVD